MTNLHDLEHLSGYLHAHNLSLGWLNGVTTFHTQHAVTMRSHTHNHMELIYCVEGELVYELDGTAPIHLTSRMGLIIPAGVRHQLANGTESPGWRLGLHLSSRITPNISLGCFTIAVYQQFHQRLQRHALQAFHLTPPTVNVVKQLASLTCRKTSTLTPTDWSWIRIQCCSVLYHTAENLIAPPNAREPIMDKATRYLQTHFAEDLAVEQLVRHMGYSRARLYTLFKEHTGLAPSQYLARWRIKTAQALLKTHHFSIQEIAHRCGFTDAAYFAAVFKKYTGSSPRTYQTRGRYAT